MTDGAHTPLTRARPDQPANLTDQTAGPDPASAKACQPPFTHQHAKALEQAGAHHGELIRLRRGLSSLTLQRPLKPIQINVHEPVKTKAERQRGLVCIY